MFRMFPNVLVKKPETKKPWSMPGGTTRIGGPVTGKVIFDVAYDDDGKVVGCKFNWEGGSVIGVPYDLMKNANSRFVRRRDLWLQIGQYRLKIFDHLDSCALAEKQR